MNDFATFLSQNADWAYLIGAILFILTLRGLSSPASAIIGNRYGMGGMALAVVSTFFVAENPNVAIIISAMIVGAAIGIYRARTVPMTQMPETVAMGGNVEGSQVNKTVTTSNGVKIIGEANIPALIGTETSSLYARNMVNFLEPMHDKESKTIKLKRDDDMVKPTLIVDGGQVLYKKA